MRMNVEVYYGCSRACSATLFVRKAEDLNDVRNRVARTLFGRSARWVPDAYVFAAGRIRVPCKMLGTPAAIDSFTPIIKIEIF